jgi:hypothetical protein
MEKKMPNYVYGTLSVAGKKEEIQAFKEFAKGEEEYFDDFAMKMGKTKYPLDMNKFIPYPKKYRRIDDKQTKYYLNLIRIMKKVESKEKLTKNEKKIANEIALCELEREGKPNNRLNLPSYEGKDGYNSGGHEWCIQNWGTKWNFGDTTIEEEDDKGITYRFTTAWSCPMPVLFKMSKMFPNLVFKFSGDEESEDFEVEYEFKKGKYKVIVEKDWKDIQIEKIKEGNLDDFDNSETRS